MSKELCFDLGDKDCGLCGNRGVVEVIPHNAGGNDGRLDECPWCLRRAMQARVKELEQMPCDSPQANEWLNANAPTNVLQSLWAWRRIAEDGLALRDKRIAELETLLGKFSHIKRGEVTPP